jgi:NTE family protein
MDGGLVNPLPFDVLEGTADVTVAIDVTGASKGPGKRPQPSPLTALVASSQILQRSIVREKLRARQPDIYIDVDVDKFYVLEFHRFKEVLAAAQPAKDQLRRQLERVLASERAEMLACDTGGPGEPQRRKYRLAAHIVILEALDELGLRPAFIAGTSMGAICGALYATGLTGAEIRAGFIDEFTSRGALLRRFAGKLTAGFSSLWSVRSPSVIDNVTLFEMMLPDILHCDFAALKIPFVAVAADFYAIEQVILDSGPLIPALAASCALPAWSRPVVLDGRVLIDGGYVNPVPFDAVMGRADLTIAVDVTGDTQRPGAKFPKVPPPLEAMTGAAQLLFHSVTREKLRSIRPAIMIRPAVGGFGAFDYFRIDDILAAAAPAKDELKRKVAQCLERGS